MALDEAVDLLNRLAEEGAKNSRQLRTMEELKEFLKNPPRRPRLPEADAAMALIVASVRTADPDARRSMVRRLSPRARGGFLGYASRMATLAVRQNSPDLIEQGLVALVIEDGGRDWRDSVVALFQLYHSACKLGMDATATFAKISSLAESGTIKKEMLGFPHRPPGSRSLQAFCMEEEIGEEGFGYRQIPWGKKKA
ncbi:MAG TPA: hypothetical protein VMT15_20210 [Bryobacteraceae bacterium]|nr:hypothetical protein [Bryobacteraceae bacterium]